jgi:cytochrome o ubiquinol oxidase operon protein cyoD
MSAINTDRRRDLRSYIIGYVASLWLTGTAFAFVYYDLTTPRTAFFSILVLALVQMVVHFRYFLHISLGKSTREDLLLILFSALIIILMVGGTLVILFNLRARMMVM